MPNHVKNIVKMKGITKLPLFSVDKDNGEKFFDFEKIIPMPESLNIESGSIEDLAIESVMRKLSIGFMKRNYKTMRDEDYAERIKRHSLDIEDIEIKGLQYITNRVKYGHTTWYDLES